jgi:tRNA (adenine57-N1/adenine58-N1)-methyltransferase
MDFALVDRQSKLPYLIQDGDLVILYERHDSLDHLYVKKGGILQHKFGTFHHDDMIDKPYGTKVKSKTTYGWIYVLQPTPELWSGAVHVRKRIKIIVSLVFLHFFRQEPRLLMKLILVL